MIVLFLIVLIKIFWQLSNCFTGLINSRLQRSHIIGRQRANNQFVAHALFIELMSQCTHRALNVFSGDSVNGQFFAVLS